jgi:RNA polymerase sigma-70 factor (ECF subfamily)
MPRNRRPLPLGQLALEVVREPPTGPLALGVHIPLDAAARPAIRLKERSAGRRRIQAPYDPVVDDAALLARARDGDLEAFAELVRRYEHRVRAVVFRLLDDDRDVEEATQDAFVQAWRNLDRFRGEASVFTWLYRIAVNEALARLRRKRVPTSDLDELAETGHAAAAPADQPEQAAEAGELQVFLAGCIRRLAPEYRAPLVLRDVVGFSNQEVADALELSLPAAKSRIHRARMQVREQLERFEAEGGSLS